MRLFLLFFAVPAACVLVCPPEYLLVGGKKCLKIHWKEANHLDAEDSCTADGGTLVTIKSAEENQIVRNHAISANINQIWIGLYCPLSSADSYVWDDNSGNSSGYSNFHQNTVFGGDNVQKCVKMDIYDWYDPADNGKWKTSSCNDPSLMYPLPYICEVPLSIQTNPMIRIRDNFDGYMYNRGPPLTFEDAQTECGYLGLGAGGFLASIHSKMETNYVKKLFNQCHQNNSTCVNRIVLGAKKTANGGYTWFDGSIWDFENFDPLDPNSDSNTANCIVMDVQNHGLWYRVECTGILEYLCKARVPDHQNELPPAVMPPPLPDLSLSNCNSTLLIGPGSISTIGFPSVPQTSCTWNIMVLGPYRVGLFFDKWETSGIVKIYDELGAQFSEHGGQFSTLPFSEILNCNSAKVTFQPRAGSGGNVDNGFHAAVLPI